MGGRADRRTDEIYVSRQRSGGYLASYTYKVHYNKAKKVTFYSLFFRYVGNLDQGVSEELLMAVFSHVGPVRSCKIIQEVDFYSHFYSKIHLKYRAAIGAENLSPKPSCI